MVSLVDYVERVKRLWKQDRNDRGRPNGIACPECGKELMDSYPTLILEDHRSRHIHCAVCQWRGYRPVPPREVETGEYDKPV